MPATLLLAAPPATAGSLTPASTGVTASIAVACLVAAALLWFVGGHLPRVTVILVLAGSIGLADTGAGNALHNGVDSALASANSELVNLVGGGISGLIGLILAYVIYIHFDRRQITYGTLACAVLLPMVASATPGTGGRLLIWCLHLIASLVVGVFHLIGVR